MSDLVDLKYTKAEQKEEAAEITAGPSHGESYPWGLCLSLEKRELDKLGIKGLPGVGDEWHMDVIAKVTGINTSSGVDSDDSVRVALQITMAEVTEQESAAEEEGEKETPAAEKAEERKAHRQGIMGD